jgi:hypothetical protein
MELDGLLAVCVQHEMDHLEGKLFVDYLSDLKRQRIRKRIEKDRRQRDPNPPHARCRAPAVPRLVFAGSSDFAVPSLAALAVGRLGARRRADPA